MFLVRSGAIDGFEKLVSELGGNPVRLISAAGLSPSQFRNPNTYISYSKLAELLEITAQACAQPLLGLSLAGRQTSSVLGDLPLILTQHPTAGQAVLEIADHLYLHASGVQLQHRERGDETQLGLVFAISSPRGLNQLIQLSVGHLANFCTELLQLEKLSIPLYLRQPAPSGQADRPRGSFYRRIRFDASHDGIRIPSRWLDRKSHWDEGALQAHFQDYLLQLQQRYPDKLTDQLKDIIGRFLPSGECSIERVAATLDLHPRVLQKRLKKLGTAYSQLLRETRQEIAEQHLAHGSIGVTELALQLGYSDVAVFSRNFKQWTGYSPRQWQAIPVARRSGSARSNAETHD